MRALRKRHRGYGRQIHARVFRHAARAPRARADHRAFGGDALPGENAVLAADFRKHRPGDRALALGQINDGHNVGAVHADVIAQMKNHFCLPRVRSPHILFLLYYTKFVPFFQTLTRSFLHVFRQNCTQKKAPLFGAFFESLTSPGKARPSRPQSALRKSWSRPQPRPHPRSAPR